MIPALAILLAVPALRAPEPAGTSPEPETIVAVDPTRFTAVNVTDRAQLVTLGSTNGGASARTVLPPHGVLRFRYPRGTVDGLWIDFASSTGGGVAHTGPVELAELARANLAFVDEHVVFAQHDASAHWVEPLASGARFPSSWQRPSVQYGTHVPVPKPIDPKKGEKPPKVGDAPLDVF